MKIKTGQDLVVLYWKNPENCIEDIISIYKYILLVKLLECKLDYPEGLELLKGYVKGYVKRFDEIDLRVRRNIQEFTTVSIRQGQYKRELFQKISSEQISLLTSETIRATIRNTSENR